MRIVARAVRGKGFEAKAWRLSGRSCDEIPGEPRTAPFLAVDHGWQRFADNPFRQTAVFALKIVFRDLDPSTVAAHLASQNV